MAEHNFDCVVIGSGPGGYVSAIRASQLGLKTAVVERESPGGVCLNWGCIPTKTLLKSAEIYQLMRRSADFGVHVEGVSFDFPAIIQRSRAVVEQMKNGVQYLLKKNNVTLIEGHGRFVDGNTLAVDRDLQAEELINFRKAVIATGARARSFSALTVDGQRVLSYRHALALKECPKRLLVIGAGAIGVEFSWFYRSLGAEVTLVEMLGNILPIEDEEISLLLEKSFRKQGIEVSSGTTVERIERNGEMLRATLVKDNVRLDWEGDYCLVAIGVQGNIENLGLEELAIQTERSYIKVNSCYETNRRGIYAIGDVIGPPWLAHVASHEGVLAAEHCAGQAIHPLDYTNIPGCTYCQPQVASVGLSEKKAKDEGRSIKIGRFPFSASGKAVAIGEAEGFVKIIIDARTEEVLGLHLIHPEATELIGEAAIIRSHEGTASSVAATIHAHPTLSEAIMEAAANALGKAIHI